MHRIAHVVKLFLLKQAVPKSKEEVKEEVLSDFKKSPSYWTLSTAIKSLTLNDDEKRALALKLLDHNIFNITSILGSYPNLVTEEDLFNLLREIHKNKYSNLKITNILAIELVKRNPENLEEVRHFVRESLDKADSYSIEKDLDPGIIDAGILSKKELQNAYKQVLMKNVLRADKFKELLPIEDIKEAVRSILEPEILPNYAMRYSELHKLIEDGFIEKEELSTALTAYIRRVKLSSHPWASQGLLTDADLGVLMPEELIRDPSSAVDFYKLGLLSGGEAQSLLEETLEDRPTHRILEKIREIGDGDVKKYIKKVLGGALADSYSPGEFKHAHSDLLAGLQRLRSLAKKHNGTVNIQDTPQQLRGLFKGRQSLSVPEIDKMIAKDQQQNKSNVFTFDHSIWGRSDMQNTFYRNQLVITVKDIPKSLSKTIEQSESVSNFMRKVKNSRYQHHPSKFGWARIHTLHNVWVIDEVQDDFLTMAKKYTLLGDSDVKAFVLKYSKEVKKALLSAIIEQAHKHGVDKVEHMNLESKAKSNLRPYGSWDYTYQPETHNETVKVIDENKALVTKTKGNVKDSDIPLPAHYVDTYHEGPQKAGFERDESTGRWVKFSRRR